MDPDEMEEDQEAIEMMKSSQYSNTNQQQRMNNQKSLGNSPQPRRNTTIQQQ